MSARYEALCDPGASLESVINESRRFFDDLGLSEAAKALAGAQASADAPAQPVRVALPPPAELRRHGAEIIAATAAAPLDGIEAGEQYGEPWAPTDEIGSIVDHRRPDGPYLLCLDPAEFRDDLRGLTAPALRKRLEPEGLTSLTAMEYLLVQRLMTHYFSDHRFDYYGSEVSDTRWMWLPDSTLGDRTFMGYWSPGKQRVELSMCRTGSKNPRKGAYVTQVIPLG